MIDDYCFVIGTILLFNLKTMPLGIIFIGLAIASKQFRKIKRNKKIQSFNDSI